jgi:MSHA pilin protein MshC
VTGPTSDSQRAGCDLCRTGNRAFPAQAESGYTVVELIVVMVVVGIVAASFLPRFFRASKFEEMGFADAATGAIRYAQRLAVFTGCATRVEVSAGGYALWQRATDCQTGAFTRAVQRPGGQQWAQAAPNGIAVGNLDIYFDGLGRPYDHASGTPLSTPAGVSFNIGASVDDGFRTIGIAGETGFVGAPWVTPPST